MAVEITFFKDDDYGIYPGIFCDFCQTRIEDAKEGMYCFAYNPTTKEYIWLKFYHKLKCSEGHHLFQEYVESKGYLFTWEELK